MSPSVTLVYLLFFLSGATALVYQVVWARSLSLILGGSHLAVTTVLSVFMAGLAAGGWLLGRRADRTANGLRTYGLLELGIGLSALAFIALTRIFPSLYGPLARATEDSPLVLIGLRVVFAMVALAVPTTLIGGTLPLLTRWANEEARGLGRGLSHLYAINTFGAVAGAVGAGFVLLPGLGVLRTTLLAAAVNCAIGAAAVLLARRESLASLHVEDAGGGAQRADSGAPPHGATVAAGTSITDSVAPTRAPDRAGALRSSPLGEGGSWPEGAFPAAARATGVAGAADRVHAVGPVHAAGRATDDDGGAEVGERGIDASVAARLAMAGAAVSGFCALGYEVLWTRTLGLVLGTSTYTFTLMLASFLTGIALGSQAHGLVGAARSARAARSRRPGRPERRGGSILAFAGTHMAIGAAALAVTFFMRDLPAAAVRAQAVLAGAGLAEFGARQGTSFLLAFACMLVPAFFMGVSFPLAAKVGARGGRPAGSLVGQVLFWNTAGAVLGASVSGFVLVPWLGVERSLLLLSAINAAAALAIASTLIGRWPIRAAARLAAAAVVAAVLAAPADLALWNRKAFAIYRNNQRGAFDTADRYADALENTDVLYAHEGMNETIGVIRPKGADQALLVNGRVEASTTRIDRQCQYTLGHLPMLLHPRPRRVFVLGLGTGMTIGAVSAHPEVERMTLAEIERGMVPAARTFAEWNHAVLDDPRLRIVFDDGRSFLRTTRESFDVITADPIHPWSGGAASLYTVEAFRTVSERLSPGGIACQWLPIYELSGEDVRTIVRTFVESFPHAMLWLTHYDAELVGSNAPIVIDTDGLAVRIARPAIARDLASVEMGSAGDFLAYFVMGTEALRAFSRSAAVNTDDNLLIEFSAPLSMGIARLTGDNAAMISACREPVGPYLRGAASGASPAAESARNLLAERAAARTYDRAHALFLRGEWGTEEFRGLYAALADRVPRCAPLRFLAGVYRDELARTPVHVGTAPFQVRDGSGRVRVVEISAVTMRAGSRRAAVVLADNAAREIYAQIYLDGSDDALDAEARRVAERALGALRAMHASQDASVRGARSPPPTAGALREAASRALRAAATARRTVTRR